MRAFVPLLAAVCLLTVLPGAQAFVHGVDWDATGVATKGTTVAKVDVHWNGFLGCTEPYCYGTYTVVLSDPVTGAVLERRAFAGGEGVNEYGRGFLGVNFFSGDAAPNQGVAFNFNTYQVVTITYCPCYMTQAMTGTYQGWSFQAVTALEPYDFN